MNALHLSCHDDDEDSLAENIPCWHKDIVLKRIEGYKMGKIQVLDFDQAMDDIENQF